MHHYVIFEYKAFILCVTSEFAKSESQYPRGVIHNGELERRDEHEWAQSVRSAPVALTMRKPELLYHVYIIIHYRRLSVGGT